MTQGPGKKSFFDRINDAFYETVETPPSGGDPERQEEARLGPVVPPATPVVAPAAATAADQPAELTADLATKVRQDIAGRGQALAQLLALAASFADIIPEESGRYRAAMKALEKTGNITRKDVLKAANDQLRAIGSQREVFAGTVARKREEVKSLGGGAEAIRVQIAELQQTIGRLQAQEQEIVRSVALEEGRIKAAEEGFSSLLSTLEAQVVAAQEKIEKYVPE